MWEKKVEVARDQSRRYISYGERVQMDGRQGKSDDLHHMGNFFKRKYYYKVLVLTRGILCRWMVTVGPVLNDSHNSVL